MYLKLIIITILIIIIINLLFNNTNNEHLKINLSKNDTGKFENLVREYKNNDSLRTFTDIQVLNKFMINNIELKDIILNIKYPVGCYYVQYPENNTNIHDDDDIEIGDLDTMLPYAKSPEALFGGKWEEKFKNESVFFRTGGILSDDTRLNGVQANAMKNLYGWTSIAQTNLWNPGFGSQGVLEETKQIETIRTDQKKQKSWIAILVGAIVLGIAVIATAGVALAVVLPVAVAVTVGIGIVAYVAGTVALSVMANKERYASDWLYNGPPGKPGDTVDAKRGEIVEDRGTDIGHQNLLDPSLQSPVSSLELRVRNRIMKVWKRIS